MTKTEENLLEQIKGSKIENVHANFKGKENKVTFDIINEQYEELNQRLTLTNPSSDFLIALFKLAKGE